RADAGTVVAVEVLVEEDHVPPVGVPLELLRPAVDRPASVRAAQEDPGEPPRELAGHLPEIQPCPGTGRALDLEVVAVEVVELLQRLDEEIVHGEPDGAPPVRVATEEPARGLGRLVVDAVL